MEKSQDPGLAPPPPGAEDEVPALSPGAMRQLRRHRMQQRQTLVFGWILVFMLAATLAALPFATGILTLPWGNEFKPDPSAISTLPPCVPEKTNLAYDTIEVAVYNGTSRTGLAGQTAQSLKDLGVKVRKVGNSPRGAYLGKAELVTGPKGVEAAYSLSRAFPGATVKLMNRDNALVDVYLGEDFTGILTAAELDSAKQTVIPPISPCQDKS